MNTEVIEEMRSVPRWNLKVPLQIGKELSDKPFGDAVDISIKGIRILTEQPFALNQPLKLWLMLPDQVNNWSKVVVEVEGVWCKPHDDNEIFETGCRFLQIETSTLFAVQTLIDDQMSFG